MERGKIKGQGAVDNVHNHFIKNRYEKSIYDDDFEEKVFKTEILEIFPKTIVNPVKSPDLSMAYSMNPYQGCEHGCAYCFARPTHEYWGYSAGIDFERKILVKKNAPELLEKFFKKRGYKAEPILMSGNTDCYQPVERKLQITRQLLQVCLDYRHPVNILTKNALVTRDIDILMPLAEKNLVTVSLSIPTINEELRRKLEPRTSSAGTKLAAIEELSKNGIPVHIMVAPIIPGLNSPEILNIVKTISERGALSFGYTLVRLNDTVEPVFKGWLAEHYPDRQDKVLHQIASMHGGKLGEKQVFKRRTGEGNIAEMIHSTFRIARQKYFSGKDIPPLATHHFDGTKGEQLSLF
jgi:DNA repair photolyase